MLLSLLACGQSSPSTFVDTLRVVAIQSEPAEISPAEENAKVNILLADPLQNGAEMLIWSCTNFGEGCLEKEFYADNFDLWIRTYERERLITTVPLEVPLVLSGVLSDFPNEDLPFQGSLLWVLACEPNVCPIIEEVRSGDFDPEPFSDPFSMLETLPFNGVSLAFRSLNLSLRPEEERIRNPFITPQFDLPLQLSVEESQELEFSYELNGIPNEDSLIYGYASVGGFMESSRGNAQLQEESGRVLLEWFAGETVSEGEVYVVVENGSGGVGFWTAEASVSEN
ncbi:MAG: hypothetical protein VX278_18100 [Myxococcota bacterium]|nr:hypothetical protein [Myxococcota bacterium]